MPALHGWGELRVAAPFRVRCAGRHGPDGGGPGRVAVPDRRAVSRTRLVRMPSRVRVARRDGQPRLLRHERGQRVADALGPAAAQPTGAGGQLRVLCRDARPARRPVQGALQRPRRLGAGGRHAGQGCAGGQVREEGELPLPLLPGLRRRRVRAVDGRRAAPLLPQRLLGPRRVLPQLVPLRARLLRHRLLARGGAQGRLSAAAAASSHRRAGRQVGGGRA
mmetsp:Transcript_18308/g.54109  ORF Transcript_18308/g.54109 Transcript_18308/m.54109 type:complete len:221 (+) Transcript_18308:1353-2015(+)